MQATELAVYYSLDKLRLSRNDGLKIYFYLKKKASF